MSNNNNNGTKPYQVVFAVTDNFDSNGRPLKSSWVRIGAMFPHDKGGHTLKLEARPLDWTRCTLVTMPPKPREDEGGEDAPF